MSWKVFGMSWEQKINDTCIANAKIGIADAKIEKKIALPTQKIKETCIANAKILKVCIGSAKIKKKLHSQWRKKNEKRTCNANTKNKKT